MPSILQVGGVKQPKVLQETDQQGVSEENKESIARMSRKKTGRAQLWCPVEQIEPRTGRGVRDTGQI